MIESTDSSSYMTIYVHTPMSENLDFSFILGFYQLKQAATFTSHSAPGSTLFHALLGNNNRSVWEV